MYMLRIYFTSVGINDVVYPECIYRLDDVNLVLCGFVVKEPNA